MTSHPNQAMPSEKAPAVQHRIAMLCQFEEATACGIHLKGKAKAFRSLGHQVEIFFTPFKHAGGQESLRTDADGVVLRTRYYGVFRQNASKVGRFFHGLLFLKWHFIHLLFSLRSADIVILHKTLPLALFGALALRVTGYRGRIVSLLDDWEGIGGMATLRQPNAPLGRLLVSLAEELLPDWSDCNICVSKLLTDKLCLTEKTRRNTIYLPLGASESQVKVFPARDQGDFVIGYVGTFKSPWLCAFLPQALVAMAKRVPAARFVLVGGGEKLEALRNDIAALGLGDRVQVKGQVPHAEVLEILQTLSAAWVLLADVFPEAYLDASRSSTKMFEYLAYGLPILASDFGEPRQLLVNQETACLRPNTPEGMAEGLQWLYENKEARLRMGEAARDAFQKHWSHTRLMTRFLDFLDGLPRRS